MAYSSDGMLMASGGADHTVCIWDVATGEYRCTLKVTARPHVRLTCWVNRLRRETPLMRCNVIMRALL
eukprot:5225743-Pyramimonas_sp.AAC.2